MAYTVEITPAASRQIRKLERKTQRRILSALDELTKEPRPREAVKLEGGQGLLRIRVGDYRVIYTAEDQRLLVIVVKVGHRREIYRGL